MFGGHLLQKFQYSVKKINKSCNEFFDVWYPVVTEFQYFVEDIDRYNQEIFRELFAKHLNLASV